MSVNRNSTGAPHRPQFQANETVSLTILNGATMSGAFQMAGYAGGVVILPAAFDGTSLTFLVSDSEAGTYVGLYKTDDSALVPLTVQKSRAYPLPAELKGAAWVKLVAGAQTGDTAGILVCLSA